MVIQQWNAATTTRHSYTLTYQLLTDLQTFLELLRDIQFGRLCAGSGRGNPKIFGCALCQWLNPLSKFLNPPLLLSYLSSVDALLAADSEVFMTETKPAVTLSYIGCN